MNFFSNYGSEFLAFIIMSIVGVIVYVIIYKMLKNSKDNFAKQNAVTIAGFATAVAALQGVNAAFAANETHHMEFVLRLASHLVLTACAGYFLHRIWKEWKEAFLSFMVFEPLFDPKAKITGSAIFHMLATFIIEWVQAIVITVIGICSIVANLWIMAKTMGQDDLLYFESWFTTPVLRWFEIESNGMTLGEALHAMDVRLATNTVITLLEVGFFIVLGLVTYDRTILGLHAKPRVKVEWSHLAGYLIKYLYNRNPSVKPSDLSEIINHDQSVKVKYLIKLEDAFVKASEAQKIIDDRTYSDSKRTKASDDYNQAMSSLKNEWTNLCTAYTASTGKVPPEFNSSTP